MKAHKTLPRPLTSSCGNIFQENAIPETTVSHATDHKQRENRQLWDLIAVRQKANSTPRSSPFSVTPQYLTLQVFIALPTSSPMVTAKLEWGKASENSDSLLNPFWIEPQGNAYPQLIPAAVNSLNTTKSTYRKKQSCLLNKEVCHHWNLNNWQGLEKTQLVKTGPESDSYNSLKAKETRSGGAHLGNPKLRVEDRSPAHYPNWTAKPQVPVSDTVVTVFWKTGGSYLSR